MPHHRLRIAALAASLVAAVAVPVALAATGPVDPTAGPYLSLVGSLHEHSGYSDGWVGSTPKTYFESAKGFGMDFLGAGEHSDLLGAPLSTSEYCLDPAYVAQCPGGDPDDPSRSIRKWDALKDQAQAASTPNFTGFQGFEWTSDVFGHVNVYFSKNYANAKGDGGYATPDALYEWLSRRPELGGGSDGIATFNHPGAKDSPVAPQPGDLNWHDFAYDARVDDRMVGIELYNDDEEYDLRGPQAPAEGYYAHALDKGWHLGPIGAEDLGHRRTDDWGGPSWAKTVILATDRSPAAIQSAMLARRFYAVRDGGIRLDYTVDGSVMGSRLQRAAGAPLAVRAAVTWPGHTGLTTQLVTSGGTVVATGTDTLDLTRAASTTERYYFVRALAEGKPVAVSAPVWVTAAAPATHVGDWLAGDLHVHTCYSHDAYCPRGDNGDPLGDYNTDKTEFYSLGGDPNERFAEASVRGLDYLALTDHHSDDWPQDSGALSWKDPGFGTHGVIGVPGHENSIGGHAQMLGARHSYSSGDKQAAAVNAMADALRADGGVFQANHPAGDIGAAMTSCSDTSRLHWKYGYAVQPDTVEVWNTPEYVQQPAPGTENEDGIFYWQCMLDRGWHVTATGGSDSHWLTAAAVQGVGNPTTWVLATERSTRGVLEAIKAGRTSISAVPPTSGGAPLLLEADADRDGGFESMVGDTVPPGSPLRVRSLSPTAAGIVELRTSAGLQTATLTPGGSVAFTAPAAKGWAWARLLLPEGIDVRKSACDPQVGDQTTLCRQPVAQIAMTSALYTDVVVDPTPTETVSPTPTPTGTETTSPTPTPCPSKKNGKEDKKCDDSAPPGPTQPVAFDSRPAVASGGALLLAVLVASAVLLTRRRPRHG